MSQYIASIAALVAGVAALLSKHFVAHPALEAMFGTFFCFSTVIFLSIAFRRRILWFRGGPYTMEDHPAGFVLCTAFLILLTVAYGAIAVQALNEWFVGNPATKLMHQ